MSSPSDDTMAVAAHARGGDRIGRDLDALTRFDHGAAPGERPDQLQTVIALQRAGLAVVSHLDPRRVCAALVSELEALLPYQRSLVAVIDEGSGEIEVLAHAGKDIEESEAERLRITRIIRDNPARGVIRQVIETGRAIRVEDTREDPHYLVGASEMRSELCVPIVRGERVLGAINVESALPRAFSKVDELILSAVANPVAVALENAKLYLSLERELAERTRTESALAESELRYRALVENAQEGIVVVLDGVIDFANGRAHQMLGFSDHTLAARPFLELPEPQARLQVQATLDDVLANGAARRLRAIALTGVPNRWVDVSFSRIDWSGRVGALCFLSDVTETQELNRKLGYQASHDDLTGLVNRREFELRLRNALVRSATGNDSHAMCYMDLDQFKIINDNCGHVAGDELLAMLGRRLREAVRGRDTLARLGGDEFGILLEHCDIEHALGIAAKIERVVRDTRLVWEGREFGIGASIGLVEIGNTGRTVTDVLRAADAACYLAKEQGRGRVRIYREDDDTVARRSAQMQWVNRVRGALESERMVLYCQTIFPIAAMAGGERYELLVRLVEEDGTIVTPGAFLSAVEHYDLSVALDRYVVEHAMRWLGDNAQRLARIELCSINLSARSLGDVDLLDAITNAIRASGVPASKICFEITETAAIRDIRASVNFMQALGKIGCRFALDDFGAGLSSFGNLRELPVEILKIDGSFVNGLPEDATSVALISAMQNLARTLGMVTVAEFASSEAIVEALADIGVDYAQGFAIAEPFPIERLGDP